MDSTTFQSSLLELPGLKTARRGIFSHRLESDAVVKMPTGIFPLSYGQRALWFLQHLNPSSPAYNIVYAARVPIELDIAGFRQALKKLADRHAALRTVFAEQNGEPVQIILDRADPYFCYDDGCTWSPEQLNIRLTREVYTPFNLEKGPLWRATLIKRRPAEYIFTIAIHHIVADFWSFTLLMFELGIFYTAEKKRVPADLKPLRYEFTDFIRWEQEMLASEKGERLWSFWHAQLSGELPVLNLPTDRPRQPIQTFNGSGIPLKINTQLTQQLRDFAESHHATLFDVMLAAFQIIIFRYTGQEDILIGTPRANRTPGFARLIGYFVNPLVIRTNLAGNPSFASLLQQVHQVVNDAFDHSDYPFHLLVERLKLARDLSRTPLIQVVFAWQKTNRLIRDQEISAFAMNLTGGRMKLAELELESWALERRVTPFELMFWIAESGNELIASMEYNQDLFHASTIAQMLGHYINILKCISKNSTQAISALPILSESEARVIVSEWNQTQVEPQSTGNPCVHHLIAMHQEQRPEAVAIYFHGQGLSYQELNQKANQLAHYLKKFGVGVEVPVAICTQRSPELIVALLGVLKAGGAFVPIDPGIPSDRIQFMVRDAGIKLILTQKSLAPGLSELDLHRIYLDTDWGKISQESDADLNTEVTPENLAYIIYTSGSTGRPKGTLLCHQGLANLARALIHEFRIDPNSRFLQFASLSFDATIAEIFPTLLAGATIHLTDPRILLSASDLLHLIRQEQITNVILPPSVLSVLPEQNLSSLTTIISAGEACTRNIVERWAPGRTFVNAYGPTEATVCVSTFLITEPEQWSVIPIGRPLASTQLYILDAKMNPVPIGVTGELYIGGIGLARGYLNRPELTAEKFIPDPFSQTPGARLYRTGDLVHYFPDGNIEFLGRLDYQVKVRGYRIELEEVEYVLKKHPAIKEALVMANEKKDRLFAYYTVHDPAVPEMTAQELRSNLLLFLPDYMIPSAFIRLETMPITSSGKIDRKALPAPEQAQKDIFASFASPIAESERKIAAIWQQVLQVTRIGRNDNFFDLGGHSLNLIQTQLLIKEEYDFDISLVDMFKYPTVQTLARFLQSHLEAGTDFTKAQNRADRQKTAFQRQRQRFASESKLTSQMAGGAIKTTAGK